MYVYIDHSELLAMKIMRQKYWFGIKWLLLVDQLWANLELLNDLDAFCVTDAKVIDAEYEDIIENYVNGYESVVIDTVGFDETYSFTQHLIRINVYSSMMWRFQEMTKFSNLEVETMRLIYQENSEKLKVIVPENVRVHF